MLEQTHLKKYKYLINAHLELSFLVTKFIVLFLQLKQSTLQTKSNIMLIFSQANNPRCDFKSFTN